MCKIFTMTNMSKVKGINKLVNTVAKSMYKRERDGFGYAIQGKNGVFGERTTLPLSFETSFKLKLLTTPFTSQIYDRFGVKSPAVGAGIFHGRTSTNDKTLRNTHPIIKHDWTLIHNGVVTNHGHKYDMDTTNDTEHLVHYMATEGIKGIEANLTGYYAVSAFAPDGSLHIFRDDIASLYACNIDELDTLVFGTSVDLIQEICKAMKWKTSVISPVTENTYIIYKNNELTECTNIKPRGETYSERKYSGLSLGYSRGESDYNTAQYGNSSGYGGDKYDQYYTSRAQEISEKSNVLDMTVGEAHAIPSTNVNNDSDYTEDELEFLNEVTYADSSYTFYDYHDNRMTLEEFNLLEDSDKLACTVIRSDGTICDPNDYYTEKLYEGVI